MVSQFLFNDILFKILLSILCHCIRDFSVILSLLQSCFEAYSFKCCGIFLFFLGIPKSLFSWIFSITLTHRYDVTLVIGFFNVLKGNFILGFSIFSGIFSANRVFVITETTLLLTFSVTYNGK